MIIGVPVYRDLENLRQMLKSLYQSTEAIEKIVLMVADATEEEREYLESLDKKIFEIIHIPNKGPLFAYNELFKLAGERKEDLFLTQTDVTFFKLYKRDWLQEYINIANLDSVGLITPCNGGGVSGPDFINGFRWVGAWATYIPYRTIELLGGYDENIPIGWGVDVDYTYAVLMKGLKVVFTDYWVQHYPNYVERHEHEKREDIEDIKKEAYRYMREKFKVGEYKPKEQI